MKITKTICTIVSLLLILGLTACNSFREIPATIETVNTVIKAAVPGDEIVLADGVYTDVLINFVNSGTANAPITLRPQTPGGVKLTGVSKVYMQGGHLQLKDFVFDQVWNDIVVHLDSVQHSRITGCAFIESGNPHNTFNHMVCLIRQCNHNRVDHCYFQGSLSMSLAAAFLKWHTDSLTSHDNLFDHNWFKDIEARSTNGQEAIQLGGGGTDVAMRNTVEYCLFDNASGDPEIISNKSSHNIIRYNTFRDCKAELVLRGGERVLVEGNYFLNTNGGIRIHGQHHQIRHNYIQDVGTAFNLQTGTGLEVAYHNTWYQAPMYCTISRNTIINCREQAVHLGENKGKVGTASAAYKAIPQWDGYCTYDKPPAQDTLSDNLFVRPGTALVRDDFCEDIVWDNNVCWAGEDTEGCDTSFARIQDPQLVHNEYGIYVPSTDFVDIGASETVLGGKYGQPLAGKDVGPEWMGGEPGRVQRIEEVQRIPSYRQK